VSDENWLSDHLLGEEAASDAAEARRRLDEDPALRARVVRLAEVTGALDQLSPAAWEVASGQEPAASAPGQRAAASARWQRLVPAPLTAVLAVIALAVGIGVGALVWSGGGGGAAAHTSAHTVALHPLPGSSGNAAGSVRVTSAGRLTLSVDRLPAAGAGHYYEAWLMTDVRHLVPLASFEVGGSGSANVTVPLPAPAARYRYFDVSLQAVSAGTAHSEDSVLRGPTGG
jgi:hypothetical protein